jgi:hypothetical protein
VDIGTDFSDLGTLAAVIAHSQIVVAAVADCPRFPDYCSLPDGYGEVDVAVLEWIAAEGRRVGRELARF